MPILRLLPGLHSNESQNHDQLHTFSGAKFSHLIQELCWLDLGKEGEVYDGHLSCDLFRVKIKDSEHRRRVGWNLEEREDENLAISSEIIIGSQSGPINSVTADS